MIEFSVSDISNTIDGESRTLIADLVLAWARYDSLVSQWTYRSFGMGPDAGSIFIGNMDTKSKLDKLKALHTHYGQTKTVEKIAELAKLTKTYADVRNTICHKTCGGHSKSDPNRLIFSDARIYKTKPGRMMVELIHLDQIKAAATFADENADLISKLVEKFATLQEEQPEPLPDNPQSSPPDPQHD